MDEIIEGIYDQQSNDDPIITWLTQIINARYGEEVRSAIYNSISKCYDDVTTSATTASSAASEAITAKNAANTAATAATNAAAAANTAASSVDTATSLATSAAASATSAATSANTAADSAASAAASATSAATSATSAAGLATSSASSANSATTAAQAIVDQWGDSDSGLYKAITDATIAANNTRSGYADAISNCQTAAQSATTAGTLALSAESRAIVAAQSIEGLTVSAIGRDPGQTPTAYTSKDGDGNYNITFGIPKGAAGEPFKIKGDAYASLSDLESDITSPAIGDMYNVGSTPPYDLYRWTGTTWENQGTLVPTLDPITTTDIDDYWDPEGTSSSAPTPGTVRYMTSSGLYYFITEAIQPALNEKVTIDLNKGLSTNDFTDTYKNLVDANAAGISTLTTGKVDKVENKGLSANDFTDALLTKLNGIEAEANKIIIDTSLDDSSTNPVQNSVVKGAFDNVDGVIDDLAHQIADEYDATSTYLYGDYCIHEKTLYRCTNNAGASGTWNSLHWTAVTAIEAINLAKDAINQTINGRDLTITIASVSSLSKTIYNSAITSEHVATKMELSNPSAQRSAWTITTSNGSLTISGTISGSTNITLVLSKPTTITDQGS